MHMEISYADESNFSEGLVYSVHMTTLPTYFCIQQLRYLSDCPHAALNVERNSTHVRDRHFPYVIFQVTDRHFYCMIFQVTDISHA
jgi:hypothetical protein